MIRTVTVLTLLALGALSGCASRKPVEIESAAGGPIPAGGPAIEVDTSVPVQDRVDEAAGLIESGRPEDLGRAVALLESATNDDRSGIVRYNLGLAYQRSGNLREAQKQYQSVIAADPNNGSAWLGLGRVHELEGDARAALSAYETGVQNAPDHTDLKVALVNGLRRAGRTDEAIETARAALARNAKSLPLYNALGLAYLDKRNLVLARFVFQKAVQEIDGAEHNAPLQANIGWTYYLDDNKPSATEHLQRALQLDPDLVPAMVQLSRVYMDDRNYIDTVPLLERAAQLEPANADVQLTLGVAYRGVGRLDDAKRAYERALALDPADPAPRFNLGVLEADYRKDYDAGIAAFRAYLAADGPEKKLAEDYIKAVELEKSLADKRAKAEAERKARAEERKKKEALLEQGGGADGGEPAPEDGAEDPSAEDPSAGDPGDEDPNGEGAEPAPSEEPAPAPEGEQP